MSGTLKDGAYYPLGIPEEMSEGEYQTLSDMGDHAQDAFWHEQEMRANMPPPSLGERFGYWRTKDGRVLEISKMATVHLDSAIKLFEKFGHGDHSKIQELRNERSRR